MRLVNAAVLWTAVSALVTPFIGLCLARRRVEVRPDELVTTSMADRASAVPLDL
jgi:hypothetical protein